MHAAWSRLAPKLRGQGLLLARGEARCRRLARRRCSGKAVLGPGPRRCGAGRRNPALLKGRRGPQAREERTAGRRHPLAQPDVTRQPPRAAAQVGGNLRQSRRLAAQGPGRGWGAKQGAGKTGREVGADAQQRERRGALRAWMAPHPAPHPHFQFWKRVPEAACTRVCSCRDNV